MPKPDLRCAACRVGNCVECLDVLRILASLPELCPCKRPGHAGEPHGAPGHVCNEMCGIVNG